MGVMRAWVRGVLWLFPQDHAHTVWSRDLAQAGNCTVAARSVVMQGTANQRVFLMRVLHLQQNTEMQGMYNVIMYLDTSSMVTGPSLGSLAVTSSLLEWEDNREAGSGMQPL